jgi:hypothetical protein
MEMLDKFKIHSKSEARMNLAWSNNCYAHHSPSFEDQCDENGTSFPNVLQGG